MVVKECPIRRLQETSVFWPQETMQGRLAKIHGMPKARMLYLPLYQEKNPLNYILEWKSIRIHPISADFSQCQDLLCGEWLVKSWIFFGPFNDQMMGSPGSGTPKTWEDAGRLLVDWKFGLPKSNPRQFHVLHQRTNRDLLRLLYNPF